LNPEQRRQGEWIMMGIIGGVLDMTDNTSGDTSDSRDRLKGPSQLAMHCGVIFGGARMRKIVGVLVVEGPDRSWRMPLR
jgi:hypothetical protein